MENHEHDFDYKPESKRIVCQCGDEQTVEDYTLKTLQQLKGESGGCLPILTLYFAFMAMIFSMAN